MPIKKRKLSATNRHKTTLLDTDEIILLRPTEVDPEKRNITVDYAILRDGILEGVTPGGPTSPGPTVTQTTGASTTSVISQKGVTDALALKVDKVTGKGLSTNDFTTALLTKLNGLVGITNTQKAALDAANSPSISNPFATLADIPVGGGGGGTALLYSGTGAAVDGAMTQKATTDSLALKVDKVAGKALSQNDYSNTEKNKVTELVSDMLAAETELQQHDNRLVAIEDREPLIHNELHFTKLLNTSTGNQELSLLLALVYTPRNAPDGTSLPTLDSAIGYLLTTMGSGGTPGVPAPVILGVSREVDSTAPGGYRFRVDWQPVSGATAYEADFNEGSDPITTSNPFRYHVGFTLGNEYRLRVRALTAQGSSAYSVYTYIYTEAGAESATFTDALPS